MSDSIQESLAASVLRLGNECRDLANERNAIKEHIRYLEIELKCETGRWERTMEENAHLKAEVERLRKAGDNLITALDKRDDVFDNSDKRDAIKAWNAAKEGKPSV